jgi:hypothetical protein
MDRCQEIAEMVADIPRELTDDMIDAFVDWQEECLFLEDAYDLWTSASPASRDLAFAAYRAALDREQQACLVFAKRCDRLARVVTLTPQSAVRR